MRYQQEGKTSLKQVSGGSHSWDPHPGAFLHPLRFIKPKTHCCVYSQTHFTDKKLDSKRWKNLLKALQLQCWHLDLLFKRGWLLSSCQSNLIKWIYYRSKVVEYCHFHAVNLTHPGILSIIAECQEWAIHFFLNTVVFNWFLIKLSKFYQENSTKLCGVNCK